MYLPLAVHPCHVCCYVHRSIQHLFKWHMFSVHAVQRYNLRHATTVKATLCVCKFTRVCHFSKQFHTHQRYTSCRNTTCSVFAWPANTRDTAVVFLCQASAGNALLPVDWAGMPLDLVYPLKCHIFLLRMVNQFANENFTGIFVRQFAATWLVYTKCVEDGHVF